MHHGDGGTLALVGDAAHAIVPFFGQGANCALEDCIEIDRCLTETGGDWRTALAPYEQRRKANCDAIADMALDNFIEMRDRVNSPVVPGQDRRAARTGTAAARPLCLPVRAGLVLHDALRADPGPDPPAGPGDGLARRPGRWAWAAAAAR